MTTHSNSEAGADSCGSWCLLVQDNGQERSVDLKTAAPAVTKARRLFVRESATKTLPLTCVMEERGWSEIRFGRDAVETSGVTQIRPYRVG